MKYSGFTAIELLITLFVAAMALASGYQLYSTVLNQDTETRLESQVGTIAYTNVKKYSSNAATPCSASQVQQPVAISSSLNGVMTIITDCPNLNLPNLSRITVAIKYGSPEKTVTHSAYASPGGP